MRPDFPDFAFHIFDTPAFNLSAALAIRPIYPFRFSTRIKIAKKSLSFRVSFATFNLVSAPVNELKKREERCPRVPGFVSTVRPTDACVQLRFT